MAQTYTIRLSDIIVQYLTHVAELTKQPVDAIIEQSLAPDLNVHRLLEIVSRVEVEREIDGGADNAQPSGHVLSRIFQRFWPKLTARVATLG